MFAQYLKAMAKGFDFRRTPPIDSMEGAISYVAGKAAFVSQFTLYSYIKTRAGTQYPKLFENETYLKSMKIARWHIYGAAVGDLALFLGARLVAAGCPAKKAEAVAVRIIETVLRDTEQDDIDAKEFTKMIKRGKARAAVADWEALADGAAAFQSSADALMRWAPLAEEFKELDDEIVRNSIHMKWINVREEMIKIIRADGIIATL